MNKTPSDLFTSSRQAAIACRIRLLKCLLSHAATYAQQFRQGCVDLEVVKKADRSPVTEIDYLIQAVFMQSIERLFPNDHILGEEQIPVEMAAQLAEQHPRLFECVEEVVTAIEGDSTVEVRWIIDPIDGTKGFIRDLAYAVGVALLIDTQPVACGIASVGLFHVFEAFHTSPLIAVSSVLDSEVDYAYADGTVFNPNALPTSETLVLVSRTDLDKLPQEKWEGLPFKLIGMDSMAKYVAVALGVAAAYVRGPIKGRCMIWDHLPGIFLMGQVDGVSIDFNGQPIQFDASRGTVCLNDGLISCRNVKWASKFRQIMQQSRLV